MNLQRGLDSHTANMVIDIMKELGHEMGTTFVVATHDSRMAERCDRVIELLDGQLLGAQLQNSPKLEAVL